MKIVLKKKNEKCNILFKNWYIICFYNKCIFQPFNESTTSPLRKITIDDSMVQSPTEIEGVVMRRRPVKKFNTVAYRGDKRPDKWKRASINGHLYSYEVIVV